MIATILLPAPVGAGEMPAMIGLRARSVPEQRFSSKPWQRLYRARRQAAFGSIHQVNETGKKKH
jgi:hypothetical protein